MKAYLISTGIVFSLITVAHILRVFAEGLGVMRNPFFVLLTLLAGALAGWAGWLLSRSARRG